MRTEKQIQASRANGAKSKGPVTPAGKARSSQNATIHGLTANLALKAESHPEFACLAQAYFDQHQPVGEAETHCVEILVSCHWRQNRAWFLETALLDGETSRVVPQDLEEDPGIPESTIVARTWRLLSSGSPSLTLLMRYESEHSRGYFKALKTLSELQAARRLPRTRNRKLRNEPAEPSTPFRSTTSPTRKALQSTPPR